MVRPAPVPEPVLRENPGFSNFGAGRITTGPASERPPAPADGYVYYNQDSSRLEVYDTMVLDWVPFETQAAVAAAIATLPGIAKWKASVIAATTAAGVLATDFENGDTLDGVTLTTGDRILVKDQAAGAENGIYIVAATGAPTRATDADTGPELVSAVVGAEQGTVNAERFYVCTNNTITIGVTALVWSLLPLTTGALTVTSVNKVAITAPATSATLTIADGKTLTASDDANVSGTHSGTSSGTNTGDTPSGRSVVAPALKTSSGSFTTSALTNFVDYDLVGCGGGGGGAEGVAGQSAAGAGGASGGRCRGRIAVSPSTLYNYVIGAGGTAGAAGNNAGGVGGDVTLTIGATVLTATGGNGGNGGAATATQTASLGGSAFSGANGAVLTLGTPGGPGSVLLGAGDKAVAGQGGTAPGWGGGGLAKVASGAGVAGGNYGGGGSGGVATSGGVAKAGGAGAAGALIIEEIS